jgi:hypothetical protein
VASHTEILSSAWNDHRFQSASKHVGFLNAMSSSNMFSHQPVCLTFVMLLGCFDRSMRLSAELPSPNLSEMYSQFWGHANLRMYLHFHCGHSLPKAPSMPCTKWSPSCRSNGQAHCTLPLPHTLLPPLRPKQIWVYPVSRVQVQTLHSMPGQHACNRMKLSTIHNNVDSIHYGHYLYAIGRIS